MRSVEHYSVRTLQDPLFRASRDSGNYIAMNQYDMDEYVLPRRRNPWVLVGTPSQDKPAVYLSA